MSSMSRLMADYADTRRRHPYMSATSAYQQAIWRATAPTMDDGDEWETDGFTVKVSTSFDDYGFDGDDVPEFLDYAEPDAVHNPSYEKDSRRPGSDKPYARVGTMPFRELVNYYRGAGASRTVAREIATAVIVQHLERWTWDYGPTPYVVTVTASRAGVELGRASLGGVDLGDSYGDAGRYLAECASELESEAIESARDAVRAICVGATS